MSSAAISHSHTQDRQDALCQLRQLGPAKGLRCAQEMNQPVDDEQDSEKPSPCSQPRKRAASARRSASRLSGFRESRRINPIPGEAKAQ
jgi:hypothetical protein